jgi:hypothetical protein
MLAIRTLYSSENKTSIQPLHVLLALIPTTAGLWICFQQLNPLFEDICVQAFLLCLLRLSLHGHQHPESDALPLRSLFGSNFSQKAGRTLLQLFAYGLLALPLLLITLALLPGSELLPELRAWLAAGEVALKEEATHLLSAILFACVLFSLLPRLGLLRKNALLLIGLILLLYVTHLIRSHALWDQHRHIRDFIPSENRILYFPSMEPFHTLSRSPHLSSMVVIDRNTSATPTFTTQVSLLLPTHASELCQAMNWRIERKHGIFTVCAMTQDSLWKLFPLN